MNLWFQVLVHRQDQTARVCWVDKKVRRGQYIKLKADPLNEPWFVLQTLGETKDRPEKVYRVGEAL